MKTHGSTISILVVICLALTACGAGQTPVPTFTPAPALPPPTQTLTPTIVPTAVPTLTPTIVPTAVPTLTPTIVPTAVPTLTPTPAPGKIYGKIFVDGTNAPIVTKVILGEFVANASGSTTAKLFESVNFFTADSSGLDVLSSTKTSLTTDAAGNFSFAGLKPNTRYKLFVVLSADNPAFSACKTISLPNNDNWTFYVTFINGLSKPPVPAGEVLKEILISGGDSLERNLAIPCDGKGNDGSFSVKVH